MVKIAYPKTNAEKAKLYLHCMVEVKERLHVVVELLALPIAPLFKQELCFLQFRYVCELIAIACLAAQGDYETQRDFTVSYKPPDIFKSLRKLYPDFFPIPAERIVTVQDDGQRHHHVKQDYKPDAYTEEDVSSLWKAAGSHLHRASVNKYLRTTFVNKPPELDGIARHLNGLIHLLNSHLIPIQHNATGDVRLLIEMGERHGPVRILFLNVNHVDCTMGVEEYLAELQR